ncbi:hypothetical protein QFZ23_001159 [Arthrobacter globiformis]|nr:hypothetical protein [Arthrobacter globiformis]
MEAIGEQGADTAAGRDVSGLSAAALLRSRGLRSVPSAGLATAELASQALATSDLEAGLALLDSATTAAQEELAAANFLEAADFAELAEELSRRIEYLQLLAAAAVDRTRTEAINAAGTASRAAGWTTGWNTEPAPETATGSVPVCAVTWSPADDGSRNTAEFLRTRLRISTTEARRRLALATATLPRTGLAGRPMPPEHQETAAALTAGIISSRAGTIITTALDKVRHIPDPAAIVHMEHNLTQTAIDNDHDFLTRIAHRWINALDQDGTEPSEETLRHRQGIFLHHKRGGLHHFEVHATTDQFEVLTTIMNTATNPRTTTPNTTHRGSDGSAESTGPDNSPGNGSSGSDSNSGSSSGSDGGSAAAANLDAVFNAPAPVPDLDLDRRTRPQQLLDGLVGGCKAALAAGTLPTTGGLRPQVMVTVSYQDLLNSIQTTASPGPPLQQKPPHHPPRHPANRSRHLAHQRTPARSGHRPAPQPRHRLRRHQLDRRRAARHTHHRQRNLHLHRTRHRLHHPQNRLRRRHHPHTPRHRRTPPRHRPHHPHLPAPHPQSPHRPRPRLRLPQLHHPRPLVRSPSHHLLVTRRTHRHRQRRPPLHPPPPPHPQRTVENPRQKRDPLVHPATPHRPPPTTPTKPPPQNMNRRTGPRPVAKSATCHQPVEILAQGNRKPGDAW